MIAYNKILYRNKNLYLMYIKNNPIAGVKILPPKDVTLPDDLIYDDTTIPYILPNYYDPQPTPTEEVTISVYFTDYYQREYYYDDTSMRFTVYIDLDGTIREEQNVPAGDYDIKLGTLTEGTHYFGIMVKDNLGNESAWLYDDLRVKEKHIITDEETYVVTQTDLDNNNITLNLDDTATEEQMINNRVGLSVLLETIKNNGYKKIVLPTGTYRVNRCLRKGTVENKDCPILIPSGITLDMNNSTFKMHPYNDTEYGNSGGVENMIVNIIDCTDTYLMNGTLEGNYAERIENGWLSSNNGEHDTCVGFTGSEYCGLDNVTITQISGYNLVISQNGSYTDVGKFTWENLNIIDGEEIASTEWHTSTMGKINFNNSMYLTCGVWLGFGGTKGNEWYMYYHWYDENQQYIYSTKSLQYRRCRIPSNAKYVRVSLLTDSTPNVSFSDMKLSRYITVNGCNWIDNRTCIAVNQAQHLLIENCKFTRSGQDITPGELDIEDGWERTQDFFFRNNEILESVGTFNIIVSAGHNFIIENNTNFSCNFRYSALGCTYRNNNGGSCNIVVGFKTKNTVRVYNNIMTGISGDVTTNVFYGYDRCNYLFKNNTYNLSYTACIIDKFKFQGTFYLYGALKKINIVNSDIYITNTNPAYLNEELYFTNCTFKLYESNTITTFSFNQLDATRIFQDCTFDTPCIFKNHNYFNSATFNNCIFNYDVEISPHNNCDTYDINFNNCIFKGNVSGVLTNVNFNNCKGVE